MHDVDRTQAEYLGDMEMEGGGFGFEMGEYAQGNYIGNGEAVFGEEDELELAAELLDVTDDVELDQFVGRLVRRGARAAGRAIRSPVGRAVGGALRNVARQALPKLGAAAGNVLLPGVGGVIGGRLAARAGQMLGLELEGLSPEDQEFEVARQLVRLGGEAVKEAANAPANTPPQVAARDAMIKAAQAHAPGLIRPSTAAQDAAAAGMAGRRSGRWVRRGNRILILGI